MLYSVLSPETALLITASVCQGPGPTGSWYFGTAAQPTSSERPELSLPQYCDGHHELEVGLPGLHHSGRLRSHHPHRHLWHWKVPVIAILYWLRIVVVRLYLMKRESTYILTLKSILKNSAVIHKHLLEKMFLVEKDTVSCSCYCDVVVWQYLIRRQ